MTPEPPAPTPRRKRRYLLWLGVLLLACFAYGQWKAYDYRAAVKEAQALGWQITDTSPFDDIKLDWHAAMDMKTWTNTRRHLVISGYQDVIGHESLLLRLNPEGIQVAFYSRPLNLLVLKRLSDLRWLSLFLYPELTNEHMDQIQELTQLKELEIVGAGRFTRLNPLIGLKKLKSLSLSDVPGIPDGDIEAFKAAHPNTKVYYRP